MQVDSALQVGEGYETGSEAQTQRAAHHGLYKRIQHEVLAKKFPAVSAVKVRSVVNAWVNEEEEEEEKKNRKRYVSPTSSPESRRATRFSSPPPRCP